MERSTDIWRFNTNKMERGLHTATQYRKLHRRTTRSSGTTYEGSFAAILNGRSAQTAGGVRFKANMLATSSDTNQLQLFKLDHFKLEIFKSI